MYVEVVTILLLIETMLELFDVHDSLASMGGCEVIIKSLTMDYSLHHVRKMPHFLHFNDHFCRFHNREGAL